MEQIFLGWKFEGPAAKVMFLAPGIRTSIAGCSQGCGLARTPTHMLLACIGLRTLFGNHADVVNDFGCDTG